MEEAEELDQEELEGPPWTPKALRHLERRVRDLEFQQRRIVKVLDLIKDQLKGHHG